MKKNYLSPKLSQAMIFREAIPFLAPLAMLSATTAAAAVGGAVVGAVATKKMIEVYPDERQELSLLMVEN